MNNRDIEELMKRKQIYEFIVHLFDLALGIGERKAGLIIWTLIGDMLENTGKGGSQSVSYASDMVPSLMCEMLGEDLRDELELSIEIIVEALWVLRDRKKYQADSGIFEFKEYSEEIEFAKGILLSSKFGELGNIWKRPMKSKDKRRIDDCINVIEELKRNILPFACNYFKEWFSGNKYHDYSSSIDELIRSKKAVVRRLNAYEDMLKLWIQFLKI